MQLSFLKPVGDRPGPWASVYVDTTHNTEDADKRQELAARATAAELREQGADDATVRAVHDRLTGAGEEGTTASAGRALFAAGGDVVLDVPLPGAPSAPFAEWGPLPRIAPLVETVGEAPVCLVVSVDRTGADFALRAAGSGGGDGSDAGHVSGADWPIHRTASADWSERHFQNRVENTWEHNAGEIADAAAEAFEESGASVLLLTGDVRERRAVHDKLPEPVRAVAYESEHGGREPGAAHNALLERDLAQVLADYERDRAAAAMDRFHAGAEPVGGTAPYAAAGVPALVEAAREHRIATLILGHNGSDAAREVWVGPDPDQVGVRASDLQYLGEVSPSSARADDALVRAAVASGADAVVVNDPADVPSGGLGAVLRWTEPARQG
ncbi:Vms1/Ankzf1 family peptidyl-tRNA hydrolase [Streptomyces sp. NPDC050617]|uniref:baeRF2 domain-containing protein n=1 Tax=Streptomyces sp. NPDC050617 TaxID=3154628 RepID=UPI0034188DAE